MRHGSIACTVFLLLLTSLQSCREPEVKDSKVDRDKFSEHIRSTKFQTPEEERAAFKLPPGFEISLYASEPDISKPINMEFDDRGRLWVTQSSEYPLAADPGKGMDHLSILEDTDGDGKADKFTHFKDSLNIPIGVLPVQDGAIAYSIPNIYYFRDKNDDGKSDAQKILFGKFGYKDTHGMISNMISGFDGWIHACHGFSNTSTVAGTDGDSITMTSGHTFRFRPDGSHIEITSRGRVNPFGYTYDEKGYLYSVDCHSKPIYQIINGGDYPGFGKRAPGIGFAPEMMSYELGSTALSGLEYYIGEQFPEEYRNSFFSGDVVTCQINRNTMTFNGSTPISKREEDFLVSNDPWFRPVAITIGPDGALYIADFYNRIIGHYEVALDHPGRDRISGRIWRISYKGDKPIKKAEIKDWSKATLDELVKGLDHPQLTERLKIADRLVYTWKEKAIAPLNKLIGSQPPAAKSYVHALWILSRLNALPETELNKAIEDADPLVRLHSLRILAEKNTISPAQDALAVKALSAEDAHIRRAAAMVIGKFLRTDHVKLLIDLYGRTDAADTHLRYTALLGVKNNLQDRSILKQVIALQWNPAQLDLLRKAMQDVPSAEGAEFLMEYITKHDLAKEQMVASLEYVGRYLPRDKTDAAIDFIRQKFANDVGTQFELYSMIRQGIAQSGLRPSAQMKQWGISMARNILGNINELTDPWKSRPLNGDIEYEDPWVTRDDFFYPMVPKFRVLYSERFGYVPTSILTSNPFKLPAVLKMNYFDYDIHNTDSRIGISKNVVRIRLKENNKVIGEYRINQKTPTRIEDVIVSDLPFDLKQWEGREGYIEVVDSSATSAVGIGKLQPEVLPMPDDVSANLAERRLRALEIVTEYQAVELVPELRHLLSSSWMNQKVRIAAAGALINISPRDNIELIGSVLKDKNSNAVLRKGLANILGEAPSPETYKILQQAIGDSSLIVQTAIAKAMAGTTAGIDELLKAIENKTAPPFLISDISLKEQLDANASKLQRKQIAQLSEAAGDVRSERNKIIQARLKSFSASTASSSVGKTVFVQNCSMCHSVKSSGGMVGPQLDGIGNWGAPALAQKILDPNRNISEAFRTYNIKLKNGKLVTGLYRRTEGETLVYADPSGKEFSVAKADIKENIASKYTLMPDQFRNTIPEKDFDALLKYLTSLK